MPTFVTPGVARLGLLLIASLGIFLEWQMPIQKQIRGWSTRARRLVMAAFVVCCCLLFVAVAFYVTANSVQLQTPRHLKSSEMDKVTSNFKEIKDRISSVTIAISSGDEPSGYALDWQRAIDAADIAILTTPAIPDVNECGLMVGVKDIGR